MTIKTIYLLAGWLLTALLSVSVAALEPVKQTVGFGFLLDGSPVSSRDNEIRGFCREVFTFLKTQYIVVPQGIKVDQRFDKFVKLAIEGVANDAVRVQCGPDSKTEQREKILKSVNGHFSYTFAKTSVKLLIRNTALDTAADQVSQLRIGVGSNVLASAEVAIEHNFGMETERVNTSSIIKNAFPTAKVVPLSGNREEALDRLRDLPNTDANAIDAYASDEILLNYMWAVDLKDVKERYSLYPATGGYSNEEYALSVYNDQPSGDQGAVLLALNDWLANNPTAKAAAKALQPSPDGFTSALKWLNREDHLSLVRWIFYRGLGLMLLILGLVALRRYLPLSRTVEKIAALDPSCRQNTADVAPEYIAIESSNGQAVHIPMDVKLTQMELKVLRLKLQNYRAKEISGQPGLPLTERTVETHIGNINRKFNTTSSAVQQAWLDAYDSHQQADSISPSLNEQDIALDDHELETLLK
jgi:DNA-binding CsgD family transcriptional regulator